MLQSKRYRDANSAYENLRKKQKEEIIKRQENEKYQKIIPLAVGTFMFINRVEKPDKNYKSPTLYEQLINNL